MFKIITPDGNKPFTIGRKEGNDLRFSERFVSREHAVIERSAGANGAIWKIRSLTENSFTLVNDEQVSECELHDGDIIGIGVKKLRVDFKEDKFSLLLYDINDEVHETALEDTFSTIEFGDEESRIKFQAKKLGDGAELRFTHAVIDENGRSSKKTILQSGESIRYDQTEMGFKNGSLFLRKTGAGFDVHVRDLDVFAGKKRLLSGIDFDLPAGEILAIIGRSGQGKSSLLKLFEGTYRKGEKSEVTIGGVDYRQGQIRERIALLEQEPPLRYDLTVEETLRHSARIALDAKEYRDSAEGRLEKFCELFGLSGRRQSRIRTLSGGEMRRVALAAELMGSPGLIILDEPLSGLDPYNSRILCSHLKQLAFLGHTVILTTHSYEALRIANKVLVLHQGEQCFYGSPQGAYQFFKTNNPDEILSNLSQDASSIWQNSGIISKDIATNKLNHVYFSKPKRKGTFFYGMALTARQWLRDRGKTLALFVQPFVIGFLFSQIFSKTSSLWTVAFAVVLCSNWFSLSLSIREIVQEKNTVKGEFRKGAGTLPYLAAKFTLPAIVSALQTAIVYAFIAFRVPIHNDIPLLASIIAAATLPAIAMGLLVSSLSKNSGQANAFLPLLIIPQVALAGALVPFDQMQQVGKWLSYVVWSRYSQDSLLNFMLEHPDDVWDKGISLMLTLLFFIITATILYRSKKAR